MVLIVLMELVELVQHQVSIQPQRVDLVAVEQEALLVLLLVEVLLMVAEQEVQIVVQQLLELLIKAVAVEELLLQPITLEQQVEVV
jgi:hypothetical protein